MIAAGIGFRASCTADELVALVETVLAGRHAELLAAPSRKHGAATRDAAARLGLRLALIDDPAIAAMQPLCLTHSDAVRRATGHGSIAEACALAATRGRLLGPRSASAAATCALAER